MPDEGQRPLQRLTPLRDDPAAAWLSTAGRLRVGLTAVLGWGTFAVAVMALDTALLVFLHSRPLLFFVPHRLIHVGIGILVVAIRPAVRRAILRQQSLRIADNLRRGAAAEALSIDDWDQLASTPDDQPVSVVGWARARLRLPHPVAGAPCIGLALPCQHRYPGVLETSHDFDLVDEAGRSLPIQVADARMLGDPTVDLGGGDAQHVLIGSLDLPAGATPSGWRAFVVRDGDPLLIVGFRRSMVDPTAHGLRQSPMRAAVASSPPRPLLIFPIDAERRDAQPGVPWG
jgi:hypothetical protein